MLRKEIEQLPKVELHCHLDGSISLAGIRELAKMAKVTIPATDEELKTKVTVQKQSTDLKGYLATFDYVLPLLQTVESLTYAAKDVLKQAAAENVIYIEVRFAPLFHTKGDLSVNDAIKAVLAGLKAGEEEYGIKANALLCGIRQMDAETNEALFTTGEPHLHRGVAGFDFAGNEPDFPTTVLTSSIKFAQELGVPLTIHAGECGNVDNVKEAVALGIKRIGHGTAMFDHPNLIETCAEKHVVIELCLTSNMQTKAMPSIKEYPLKQLMAAGALVCINTDNRTVSDTSLTKEYLLFQDLFHIRKAQLKRFNLDAIEGAFIDEPLKAQLRATIEEGFKPEKK